jgi:hypothetical protein
MWSPKYPWHFGWYTNCPLLNMLAFLMRTTTITTMRATQLFVKLLWITWSSLLVYLWHFLDLQTIHKLFASLCFIFKFNIMGYFVHKEATKMELPFLANKGYKGYPLLDYMMTPHKNKGHIILEQLLKTK